MSDVKWLIATEVPHLRRFAIALTGDREAADDLVQDCVVRALRKRHLWRRRGSLRSWLFRILYRIYVDGVRAPQREVALPHDAPAAKLVQPPAQEARVEVRNVVVGLRQLPADQRAAILLVALEGLPYDEAADALDIPVGTLRSRLSRGREALRGMMAGTETTPLLRRVK